MKLIKVRDDYKLIQNDTARRLNGRAIYLGIEDLQETIDLLEQALEEESQNMMMGNL